MKILTVSNLYPRPDEPERGMYNAQLFAQMAFLASAGGSGSTLRNVCLVPEWRLWKWPRIRSGVAPAASRVPTQYMPAAYLPYLGRNCAHVLYRLSIARPMRSLLESADCVYASWLYPDGVAAVQLATERGIPAWLMVLGSDTLHLRSPVRRRAVLDAVQRAQGVVCVAAHLRDRLVAAGAEAAKVHVVPNGVDTELFRYRPLTVAQEQLAGSDSEAAAALARFRAGGERVLLFVGNLVPVKGPDLLVEAMRRLVASCPQRIRLILIGQGSLERQLRQSVQQAGLEGRVVFVGRRPHREIALWMNLADGLCLCSRSEGMPNVVLESMASGLPVVATDVGACRSLLEGEPECRVVPAEDAVALAQALGEVLAATPDREAMSLRHRQRRSWRRQAEDILRLMGAVE